MDRLAYPITDAAERIGVGRTTLYGLIESGDLESVTIGRRRLVTEDALRAFLARRAQAA
ncbi:helix-turn-helix domain-containing protein [Aquihabitans sp. McL0605]|uniref:helix-turn-helix domain-containing protein n=1 Tax=Aquihabitans sp. McL0605 TaxID=3415671 RepID=UPI003CF48F92